MKKAINHIRKSRKEKGGQAKINCVDKKRNTLMQYAGSIPPSEADSMLANIQRDKNRL